MHSNITKRFSFEFRFVSTFRKSAVLFRITNGPINSTLFLYIIFQIFSYIKTDHLIQLFSLINIHFWRESEKTMTLVIMEVGAIKFLGFIEYRMLTTIF